MRFRGEEPEASAVRDLGGRPVPHVDLDREQRFGTPNAAILLMAILNAVLIVGPFRNLVVIDVILFIALFSCPVLYCVSSAICRGPATPWRQAGNEALAPAAADAAEGAA
jgi:hypothetical protein